MPPWLRTLKVLIHAWRRRPLSPLEESVIHLRVWPNDLDPNLHLTNGRYFALMDLGRMDLAVRCGLGRILVRKRWKPMVASVHIRFRRPLPPWSRFELRTRLVGWDAKWLFLEHTFTLKGHIMTRALIKGVVSSPQGLVPPSRMGELLAPGLETPMDPEQLSRWWVMEEPSPPAPPRPPA